MSDERGRDRVALVGYTFYESDARLHMYVEYLTSAGYDIDVVVLKDPHGVAPLDTEHVSYYFPRNRRFERQGVVQYILDYAMFTIASMWILLMNHFRGQRYAMVHINNMPNFLIFSALPLRILGTRVLLDVHDTMPEIFRVRSNVDERHWLIRCLKLEERVCLKLADFVITSEHTKRDRLLENGLNREKSDVVLNLANPNVFPEVSISEQTKNDGKPFRIVYHGTLTRRLGVDTVLRAVAIARQHVPNIRFEVTGDGEQRDELIALARDLGIESCVAFSDGFVPVESLRNRLMGADLGVMASRDNAATALMLPVKLLEYIRLGIPCIAVPTKTIAYYFSEPAVRFIPPDDPEALAAKIVELYRDPKARQQMARDARKFYDTHSFEAQRRRYIEIVHGLAEHRAPVRELG